MLEIEYITSADESSKATLDFMLNRPVMAVMFKGMQMLCIALCFGYAITLYTNTARNEDAVAVIFALMWIFFYKRINRWVVGNTLKMRKFNDVQCSLKIDEKSIMYKLHTNQPLHIEWKRLKLILKNNDGYIIPLTGMLNAGRFLWLPKRCLNTPQAELDFLNLCHKFKLDLKTI